LTPPLYLGIVVFALQPEQGAEVVAGVIGLRGLPGLIHRLKHALVFVGAADLGQLSNGAAGGRSVTGDEQMLRVGLDAFAIEIEPPGHVQCADFHRLAFFLGLFFQLRNGVGIEQNLRVAFELHHRLERLERGAADRDEAIAAKGGRARRISQHEVVIARLLG